MQSSTAKDLEKKLVDAKKARCVPFSDKGRKTGASLESQHRSITTSDVLGDNNLVFVTNGSGAGEVVSVEGVVAE